jgi:hypothetical protein
MFSFVERKGDRCEICKFRRPEDRIVEVPHHSLPGIGFNPYETTQVLVCYRSPPTANKDGVGVWPRVAKSAWCGEFREGDPSW